MCACVCPALPNRLRRERQLLRVLGKEGSRSSSPVTVIYPWPFSSRRSALASAICSLFAAMLFSLGLSPARLPVFKVIGGLFTGVHRAVLNSMPRTTHKSKSGKSSTKSATNKGNHRYTAENFWGFLSPFEVSVKPGLTSNTSALALCQSHITVSSTGTDNIGQ